MGLFSAILGNAGTVSKEDLVKDFGKLLIEGEESVTKQFNKSVNVYDVQNVLAFHVLK
jgi:hypothetical protein